MRRTRGRLLGSSTLAAVCLLAVLALGLPSRALAQRPSLAGHTFVSTELVPDAFVRTFVRNSIGYTQTAEFNYPPVIIRGDTLVTLDGSLAYALLGMEYQNAFRDWMALRFAIGLRTRLGTQASSLVNEGVNVTSGLAFGWLMRLRETSRTSTCLSLDVSRQTLTIIDMRSFVEDVIDNNPNPRLIDNVPVVRGNAGLRFAWAASRPVGVTLLLEGSYGESPQRGESDLWEYGLGASVDFDMNPAWNVPIGLALAYRESSLPVFTQSENGKTRQTLLRVAYTGKPDFLIALDLMGVLDRENSEVKPVWSGGAAFSLRYYF